MAKKKKIPKAPKPPKSNSPQAVANFERRVSAHLKAVAEVGKHNAQIEANKKKKQTLKERVQKAAAKARGK